jgi:hypothetical protein
MLLQVCCVAILTSCAYAAPQASEPAVDAHAASAHWDRWVSAQEAFPAGAWVLPESVVPLTSEMHQRYIDAGFTLMQVPSDSSESAASDTISPVMTWDRKADVSAKEVLSRFVALPGTPSSAVAFLGQEVEAKSFDALGSTHQAIYQSPRPGVVLPLASLFPNWYLHFGRQNMTYERYVEHYISRAHPAALMATHFPLLADGTDRIWFYDNLETLRRYSLDAGIGLIGQVQCVGHGQRYREPSESDIRWQVNSYVAYGAKGLWYYYFTMDPEQPGDGIVTGVGWYPKHFTKAVPARGLGVFQEGDDATRYDTVHDVNRQLHAIWPVLKCLKSVGVFHTDSKPPIGTTGIRDGLPPEISSLSGSSLLVGVFEHAEQAADGAIFIYIVNKQHGQGSAEVDLNPDINLTLTDGYRAQWVGQSDVEPTLSNGRASYSLSLPGGEGVLLRLSPHTDIQEPSP